MLSEHAFLKRQPSVSSYEGLVERGYTARARFRQPDKPSEETKPKDWIMITSLVVLILAGLVAAFAGLSLWGMFPVALLGGTQTAAFILFGAFNIGACAGAAFFYKWKIDKK